MAGRLMALEFAPPPAAWQALIARKAGQLAHSGRDFAQHLQGTAALLQQWQLPQEVVLAGLFHSVYGTEDFKRPLFALDERELVQELIGVQAEQLVYWFCHLPHKAILAGATVQVGQVEEEQLSHLRHIMLANTLEQYCIKTRYGRAVLSRLATYWQACLPTLSPPAQEQAANHFRRAAMPGWLAQSIIGIYHLMRRKQ